MAANYLPMLLAANAATPDDSSVTTLPTGQVDYLSHEWREEDVWSSWRNMTRQKNIVANGTRLENASWRTWWKQRNKLKTISPETLNWLKDSDVTWLYGPLHPGVDWCPIPHQQPSVHSQPAPDSPHVGSPSTKPILKHRSIGEILFLPPGPLFDPIDDSEQTASNHTSQNQSLSESAGGRPALMHTKSETNIASHLVPRDLRKESPPRIFSTPHVDSSSPGEDDASNSTSTGSELDLGPGNNPGGKKKHISFNTFVEQCIAIEKPKLKRSNTGPKPHFAVVGYDDDGYDEDSELGYDDSEESPDPPPTTTFYPVYDQGSDSDSDDVLEIRTSSSRSRSSSSSHSTPRHSYHQPYRRSSADQAQSFSDKEHRTIAYIAPTVLKSTGVGNNVTTSGNEVCGRPLSGVELVYVPPIKGSQNGPRYGSGFGNEIAERHLRKEDYFGLHASGSNSPAYAASPKLPEESLVPSLPYSTKKGDSMEEPDWTSRFSDSILHSEPIGIPFDTDGEEIVRGEDPFDCFVEPDLGEDFSSSRSSRTLSSEDQRDNEVVKYAQGGADSVIGGRSNGWKDSNLLPVLRDRTEQITLSQPFHVSPPSFTVPVPRSASFDHCPPVSSQLLCPSEVHSGLGRTSPTSPIGGSSSSPSISNSRSSDSRSESRGRSSTRNSSYSDRERSGSRSSRGTNSPLGSISPSGSVIGIGGTGTVRDTRSSGVSVGKERGRDRSGRKISGSVSSSPSSLSPPNAASPSRSASGDYQPYLPTQSDSYSSLSGSIAGSISSSVTSIGNMSTSSSSESTITAVSASEVVEKSHPTLSSVSTRNHKHITLPLPSPIIEEDEQRSRHPTPANSPTTATRPALSIASSHVQLPEITITIAPTPEKATGSPPKRDAFEDEQQQVGTLVSRAVEIVTSARGLLGSFWHSS